MREQLVRIAAGVQLAIGVDPDDRAWLELTAPDGTVATVYVGERELLLAIEALAMVYFGVAVTGRACWRPRTVRAASSAAGRRHSDHEKTTEHTFDRRSGTSNSSARTGGHDRVDNCGS